MTSLWPAVVALAVAGAADSVSAVCRSAINQAVTPDPMRGRMSSVVLARGHERPAAGRRRGGGRRRRDRHARVRRLGVACALRRAAPA